MKSKLEKALENIGKCHVASDDLDVIAKAIKTIEILKKYKLIEPKNEDYGQRLYCYFITKEITYEEYILFKEVLEDD